MSKQLMVQMAQRFCVPEQEPSGGFSVYFRHKQTDKEIFHDA